MTNNTETAMAAYQVERVQLSAQWYAEAARLHRSAAYTEDDAGIRDEFLAISARMQLRAAEQYANARDLYAYYFG